MYRKSTYATFDLKLYSTGMVAVGDGADTGHDETGTTPPNINFWRLLLIALLAHTYVVFVNSIMNVVKNINQLTCRGQLACTITCETFNILILA